MVKDVIGIKFDDANNTYKVIEYIEQFKMYRLKNYTTNRDNQLMKLEEIQQYLKDKENILKRKEKVLQRIIESEKESEKILQLEKEELKKYNKDYGFTSNKSCLQKGKILKILNKKVLFREELITRKDLIYKMILNNNCVFKEVLVTNRYSKKKINLEHIKLKDKKELRLIYSEEGNFLVLTKTEFDYAKYLQRIIKTNKQ